MATFQKSMNVNRIVSLGFGLVLLIMIAIALLLQKISHTVMENVEQVIDNYELKVQLGHLLIALLDAETGQRGFLFTNKPEFLEPYNRAQKNYSVESGHVQKHIHEHPQLEERLGQIDALSRKKFAELEQTINLRKNGQEEALKQLVVGGSGKALMDQIRAILKSIHADEDALLKERHTAMESATTALSWFSIVGTAIAVIIGIFVGRIIAVKIMKPIEGAVQNISATSTQVSATVSQQERIASQQAASVNETNTTMAELGASARQSSEQADGAAAGAENAMAFAQQGLQQVDETLQGMEMTQEKVTAIAKQILILSEQTNQIRNITDLVSDFANETKMLAMNAAVEAVRAGEHGKGFSVLAMETRKLAEESKRSARRISDLVGEIQRATNATVMATEEGGKTVAQGIVVTRKTADTFRNLSEAVRTTSESSKQISLNVRQQSAAIKQVVVAMQSINTGAAESKAGISQVKTGIDTLNTAAIALKGLI